MGRLPFIKKIGDSTPPPPKGPPQGCLHPRAQSSDYLPQGVGTLVSLPNGNPPPTSYPIFPMICRRGGVGTVSILCRTSPNLRLFTREPEPRNDCAFLLITYTPGGGEYMRRRKHRQRGGKSLHHRGGVKQVGSFLLSLSPTWGKRRRRAH